MAFDTQALLNAVTTAATSTEYSVLTANEEFVGLIKEVKLDSGKSNDGRDWYKANVIIEASGQKVREALNNGRDKANVRYGIWLDVTESGGLAGGPGVNVPLGKLREAVGQNKAGQEWGFQRLVGQNIIFSGKHRTGDNGELFYDVTKVLPLS